MKQIINNKFVRGGMFLGMSTIIVNICNYLFYVFVAKTVGPSGYGEIVTLFSYLAILSIPFSTIPSLMIRRLGYAGDNRAKVAQSFEKWFVKQLFKYWFLIPLPFLAVSAIAKLTNLQLITSLVLVFSVVFGMIGSVYYSLLQGLQLFKESSINSIMTTGLKLGGVILVLFGIGGLFTIYAGFTAGIIVSIFYCYIVIRNIKTSGQTEKYVFNKKIRSLIFNKATLATSASLFGITIIGNADMTIAKRMFIDSQAGMYGAWSLFAKTILYVLGPINTLSLIYFSAKETQKNQFKVMCGTLSVLVLAGLGAFIAYSLFTDQLVKIILSNKFATIGSLLPKASIFGILYAGINIMNNYFVARKHPIQLAGFLSAPIYVVSLIIFGKTINNIIDINIIYSFALMMVFIVFFLKNRSNNVV